MLRWNGKLISVNRGLADWHGSPSPSLPPYTIRLKFTEGVTPTFQYGTAVQVSSSPNIWDLTYNSTDWSGLLYDDSSLIEIIGANTSDITHMYDMCRDCTNLTTVSLSDTSSVTTMEYMFAGCTNLTTVSLSDTSSVTSMYGMFNKCTSLTTVSLFDTSNVTNMTYMFARCTSLASVPLFNTSAATNMTGMLYNCTSLTSVPLFNTSKVTEMDFMFYNCPAVQSGALALYQQASTQFTPPTYHNNTFANCGRDTVTGAAELAQIPSSWGGTGV